MKVYKQSFRDLAEADRWIKAIRAEHPDCLDYVEVGKAMHGGAGYFDCHITIYEELKREQPAERDHLQDNEPDRREVLRGKDG